MKSITFLFGFLLTSAAGSSLAESQDSNPDQVMDQSEKMAQESGSRSDKLSEEERILIKHECSQKDFDLIHGINTEVIQNEGEQSSDQEHGEIAKKNILEKLEQISPKCQTTIKQVFPSHHAVETKKQSNSEPDKVEEL